MKRLLINRRVLLSILESITDPFYVVDYDWNFIYINRKAAELWKQDRKKLIDKNIWEVFPQAVGSHSYKMHHQVARERKSLTFETISPIIHHWIEVNIYPNDIGMIVYFQDISRRKATEQAVANANRQLEMIFESVQDFAIFAANLDRKVTSWNPGAERIFGYSEAEIIGQSADILFTSEDRAMGIPQKEVESVLTKGISINERWHLKKGEIRFFASGTARPIVNDQGEITGFIKVARDITERKQAEETNAMLLESEQDARAEAERANALRSKFLAVISHELRTPLTSIKGFISTLLAPDVEWDAPTQKEFLNIIDREADRLTNLIEDILDMSRIEAGSLRVEATPQHLLKVVDNALPQLMTLTTQHPLTINIPDDLPPVVADQDRIAQVIVNLVGNAAKYTAPGTPVELSAGQFDSFIRVNVVDQGPGIPQERRTEVFEMFSQLRSGGTRKQGVGLGLAICRGLVEAHGGRIWIDETTVEGTTVAFTLPIARPSGKAEI